MAEGIQLEKEILLRGSVLQVSARIEMVLLRVVLVSNADDMETAINGFKAKTMHQKIVAAKDALQLKYNSLYLKNEQAFIDLNEMRHFRNRFAHCIIEWDGQSVIRFKIVEANSQKHPTTQQLSVTFQPFHYTLDSFQIELEKLSNVLTELMVLNNDIEAILKQKYPRLYHSITQEVADE